MIYFYMMIEIIEKDGINIEFDPLNPGSPTQISNFTINGLNLRDYYLNFLKMIPIPTVLSAPNLNEIFIRSLCPTFQDDIDKICRTIQHSKIENRAINHLFERTYGITFKFIQKDFQRSFPLRQILLQCIYHY